MSPSKLLIEACLFGLVPPAHDIGPNGPLGSWAKEALSIDPALSGRAVAQLRSAGPAGLQAMLDEHADLLENGRPALSADDDREADPRWQRLTAALDAVAGAKDTYAARLYWYTDWEQARAAAEATGRPILSLRLLGNLDQEYSCANSRFFRTALYANAEISAYLREHYVLHWKSVRPVPRVTIDFGDGRKLDRTLTGNSIHYVLEPDGRVIDALPGLYGPVRFLRGLQSAEQTALRVRQAPDAHRDTLLCDSHEERESWLRAAWNADLLRVGAALPMALASNGSGKPPDALKAATVTMGKRFVEASTLRELLPGPEALESATDAKAWSQVARLHRDEARLDAASLLFMREKSALLRRAATHQRAGADPAGGAPEMAERFMELMALDTVRNEYLYRRAVHQWLAAGGSPPDVDTLNARVYSELFLTPDSDPWLGLLPNDVYSALADDGRVHPVERRTR